MPLGTCAWATTAAVKRLAVCRVRGGGEAVSWIDPSAGSALLAAATEAEELQGVE